MKHFLILLFIPLLVSGCGLLASSPSNKSSRRVFGDPNEGRKAFSQSFVSCDNEDCPDFVAGIYGLDIEEGKASVYACSATLIGKDTVLINAHCVPKDLQFSGASCANRIKVNFPKTQNQKEERYECESIVRLSVDTDVNAEPDWAILKLSKVSQRTPVVLNKEGVKTKEKVTLYKVNFDLYAGVKSEGKVVKTQCETNANSYFTDDSIGLFSPLMNISSCDKKMITGNSGVGILNNKNEMVAIYSFGYHVLDSDKDWAKRERKKYPNIKQNSGGGTNLACIAFSPKESLPGTCKFYADEYPWIARFYSIIDEYKNGDFLDGESLGRNMKQLNNSDVLSKVQFSEDIDLLFDRFQTNYEVKSKALAEYVYREAVRAVYVILPECVDRTASDSFQLTLSVGLWSEAVVDDVLFYKKRNSLFPVDVKVQFTRNNKGYVMKHLSPAIMGPYRKFLGLNSINDPDFLVPFCK